MKYANMEDFAFQTTKQITANIRSLFILSYGTDDFQEPGCIYK